jgi:hypothetical protein
VSLGTVKVTKFEVRRGDMFGVRGGMFGVRRGYVWGEAGICLG